jgi:hypothetical protein
MNYKKNVVNRSWLSNAMLQPLTYIERSYYYDFQDKHLFFLTPIDFLAFQSENAISTTHSKADASKLRDKIIRLQSANPTILMIDRLSIEDRISIQLRFVNCFIGMNFYNELYQRVLTQDQITMMVLDGFLKQTGLQMLMSYWIEHKNAELDVLIDGFANKHQLIISQLDIWHTGTTEASIIVGSQSNKGKTWWKI